MTVIITKKQSKGEIKRLIRSTNKVKPSSKLKNLTGKLKWKGDALKVQRNMRIEG